MKTTAGTFTVLSCRALIDMRSNAQAASIIGSTVGTFSSLGPRSSPATLGTFLTFTGNSFNVTTDPSGYVLLIDLGTFTRARGEGGNDDDKQNRWLKLAFSSPSGVSDAQFSAFVRTDVGGPGAPFGIDFDETPFSSRLTVDLSTCS